MIALVLISILLSLAGVVMLSNATAGVGIIALAILVAIYARIAQAADHHRTRATPPTEPT
jgi:amino acid transporter